LAPLRTPLGELAELTRPPSWILGRYGKRGRAGEVRGAEGRGKQGKVGEDSGGKRR